MHAAWSAGNRREALLPVHPDKRVTFQYIAPGANDVKLSAQFGKGPVAMTKNASCLWSVTVGPVKPDIYPCLVLEKPYTFG